MNAYIELFVPRRVATTLALAILFFTCIARNAAAQFFHDHDGVKIALSDANWPGFAGRGYSELRFIVENTSDRTRQVELRIGHAANSESTSMSATARASVAPGVQRELAVLLPSFALEPFDWTPVVAIIDGRPEFVSLALQFGDGVWPTAGLCVVVYSDRALGSDYTDTRALALSLKSIGELDAAAAQHFTEPAPAWYQSESAWRGGAPVTEAFAARQQRRASAPSAGTPYFVHTRATHLLPQSMHAFTSLDAVVLDGGPIDPARLADVARWVRLGGCAVVARDGSFNSFGDLDDARRPGALLCRFGEARVCRLGLGTVVFSDGEPLGTDGQLQGLWWALERSPSWIAPLYSVGSTNKPMRWHFTQVVLDGIGELSHVTLLAILIVVAIIMAPVNVLLVRRTRRPVAMLITIPTLSLIASLCILVYGVTRDGLGVVDGVASWAVLDQESQMVSSASMRSIFMGTSGGRRMTPGAGTIVLPIARQSMIGSELDRHHVERDTEAGTLKFDGGFLPVRRVVSHVVLSDRSSRKRLGARRTDAGLEIENALGTAVEELWLRDRDGRLWKRVGAVGAGETAVLTEAADEEALTNFLVALAPAPYMAPFDRLAPGTFAARLSGLIAADDCGVASDDTVAEQAVIGILEEGALR